jgi:hypothetical protein
LVDWLLVENLVSRAPSAVCRSPFFRAKFALQIRVFVNLCRVFGKMTLLGVVSPVYYFQKHKTKQRTWKKKRTSTS